MSFPDWKCPPSISRTMTEDPHWETLKWNFIAEKNKEKHRKIFQRLNRICTWRLENKDCPGVFNNKTESQKSMEQTFRILSKKNSSLLVGERITPQRGSQGIQPIKGKKRISGWWECRLWQEDGELSMGCYQGKKIERNCVTMWKTILRDICLKHKKFSYCSK